MTKAFKSYDEQITLLKNKNLKIPNPTYAKHILAKTSYFSLISGYKSYFKNPTTGNFKDYTAFEDIYRLYCFDNELRSIFLKYILIAEHSVKSSLAYHFTSLYGTDQNEYLSPSHYMATASTQQQLHDFLNILSYQLTHKSNYTYITHYKLHHKNVPLWILIHVLTLGQFSHMYDFLTASVPIKVCQDFHNIYRKDMHSFLSIMTKHRNVCAHGDRFFNYTTKDSLTDTVIHQKLQIPKKHLRYQYGKNDIFSEVIILKYLLDKEDFHNFYSELKCCLNKFHLYSQIITQMGFPPNWKSIIQLSP